MPLQTYSVIRMSIGNEGGHAEAAVGKQVNVHRGRAGERLGKL